MLHVHVDATCPFRCRKSMSWLRGHVRVVCHACAACQCPCCMFMLMQCCISTSPCCISMCWMAMLHVHVACPCCMSMLPVHAACKCCMSVGSMAKLHFNAACPSCISMLHVHPHVYAEFLLHFFCCMSTLLVLAACPFCMFMLHFGCMFTLRVRSTCPCFVPMSTHVACLWYLSMLHVHVLILHVRYACLCHIPMLHVHAAVSSVCLLHVSFIYENKQKMCCRKRELLWYFCFQKASLAIFSRVLQNLGFGSESRFSWNIKKRFSC